MPKITPENITLLKDNEIFVFGSNLSGRHGKGAAKTAMKWGAQYGHGEGLSGKTYALPTVTADVKKSLSLKEIEVHVKRFKECVESHPSLHFLITAIGCGLAGYKVKDIAPLFKDFTKYENVSLPQSFYNFYKGE